MDRRSRVVIVLGAVAAASLALGWWDHSVMADIQHQATRTFDAASAQWPFAVFRIVITATMFGIAVAGWWARSAVIGVAYVLAGAFLVFLFGITWSWAAGRNDQPPLLPDPIAHAVGEIALWVGPVSALLWLGAAMLVAGAAILGWLARERRRNPLTGQP